jgi:hypothetical protein
MSKPIEWTEPSQKTTWQLAWMEPNKRPQAGPVALIAIGGLTGVPGAAAPEESLRA